MEQTLEAIAVHLKGRLIGDGATLIRGVNNLETVQEGELTFADDAHHLAQAMASHASAVIVADEVKTLEGKAGIRVHNPKLAFALALDLFHPTLPQAPGVHPSAALGEGVQLGDQVSIGAHAVLGDGARVGRGTIIESGVHVGSGVTIGDHCFIGPNVVLYRQTFIGHRVRIHGGTVIGGDGFGYVFHEGRHVKIPQVGNVVIEDDVEIGCNVCVDRATLGSTIIKRGTKIDNLVQVAHNTFIGEHVMIAGQAGFSGSVTVGDYAVFGGRAGVTDHVTIGARAQVGLCSVVTKSVAPGEVVWGYPARPIRRTKIQLAAASRLPHLLRRVKELVARLTTMETRLRAMERRAPHE